jgi:hypothetical protein
VVHHPWLSSVVYLTGGSSCAPTLVLDQSPQGRPSKAVLRLWDTYLAEERAGFENFHVYVCAVFLKEHEERLLKMSFQEILMFLQDLPTGEWVEEDIEPILSQAYILSTLYDDSAAGHLA